MAVCQILLSLAIGKEKRLSADDPLYQIAFVGNSIMRQKLHIEFLIELCIKQFGKKFERLSPYERLEFIRQVFIKNATYYGDQSQVEQYFSADYSFSLILANFFEAYLQGKTKIYIVADLFGKHLNKTPIKLPISVVPFQDDVVYCIESSILFQSTDAYHKTAYVHFKEELLENKLTKVMAIIAPDYDAKGNLLESASSAIIHLKDEFSTVDEALDAANQTSISPRKKAYIFPHEFLSFIVKALIYIESGEPDLRPEFKECSAKNPGSIRKFVKDHCPYEIVRVGYSYNKERFYHKGTTQVVGHFRWQPCGHARSRVKLIWIDEHERHYKNVLLEKDLDKVEPKPN